MMDDSGAKTTDQLTRLQRRNRLILEAAREGIYGLDRDGRATFVNPAATAMGGDSARTSISA